MPLITGPDACTEARTAFHTMIKAASTCRRDFPPRLQMMFPVSQLSAFATAVTLGLNVQSTKIHLADIWVVALSLTLIASLITLVRLALLHNKLVKPIHCVLRQNTTIRSARLITLEYRIDRQVTTIAGKDDSVVYCDLIFNPADIELVQLAYRLASKRPPEIRNLLNER